jgi:hypothetical protein
MMDRMYFTIAHHRRHWPDDPLHHPLLGSSPHDLILFLHTI